MHWKNVTKYPKLRRKCGNFKDYCDDSRNFILDTPVSLQEATKNVLVAGSKLGTTKQH